MADLVVRPRLDHRAFVAVMGREALGEDSRSVRADLALARRCSPTLADQHGANGDGLCPRHNQVKEEVGWRIDVESSGLDEAGSPRTAPHGIRITTPTGHAYDSTAPPILGERWSPLAPDDRPNDVHLLDRPLPVDPWGGRIPDPPDEWIPQEGEMRAV